MGREQISFHHKKHRISGTPDGLYINTTSNEMWLLEFKSAKTMVTQPRYSHKTQVQVNMGIMVALADNPDFQKLFEGLEDFPLFKGAKILYIDPSHYLTLQEFDEPYDGGLIYNKTRAKAAALFDGDELRRPETLSPHGLTNNGCYFCNFKDKCAAIEGRRKDSANAKMLRKIIDNQTNKAVPVMPEFKADMPREELVNLLVEYDEFSKDEKRAKKQKDALKAAIKTWAKKQKGMKAEFEDDGRLVKVGLTISNRVGNLDKARIEAIFEEWEEDIDAYTKEDIEVETLRVSVKQVA